MKEMEQVTQNQLVGTWTMDSAEKIPKSVKGKWTWDFRSNGHLKITIRLEEGTMNFDRTYWVEGKYIILRTPRLHDAKTKFEFAEDGKLILYYDSKYPIKHVREPLQ